MEKNMTILVIAEHDNKTLKASTLNTVSAAKKIGGDIHVLVAGKGCSDVSAEAAKINGVAKVIKVDDAAYEHFLAENLANLIIAMAGDYSHVLAPSNTFGKNFMPHKSPMLSKLYHQIPSNARFMQAMRLPLSSHRTQKKS
jgi:electron transfer flavoprotein alpha subunit